MEINFTPNKSNYHIWSVHTKYYMKIYWNIRFIIFPVLGAILLILALLYENCPLITNIWIYHSEQNFCLFFLLSYNYILKFFTSSLILLFLFFFLHKKHNFNSAKKIYCYIYIFYLATECLINYLYGKMCNFNFISCCKSIVLFWSHFCNSIVIVQDKLCQC